MIVHMASINQASSFLCSSSSIRRSITRASIQFPNIPVNYLSTLIPKIPLAKVYVVEQETDQFSRIVPALPKNPTNPRAFPDHEVMKKLYMIMETIADRVEIHKNIGEQRNNWNSLLLTSINTITLSAATMVASASATSVLPGAHAEVLKLTSSFMYLAVTGLLIIMNKIQPSQLVEEQRNATRLFKQLQVEIQTEISIGNPTLCDVSEAMEKVLALDKAYPLPLLGAMLKKFPCKVEPAVWWPKQPVMPARDDQTNENGWSLRLEEEMREIVKVLEVKDKADYLRLGEKALKLHKAIAIAGPLLTSLGAISSISLLLSPHNHWAMVLGVMCGAIASGVNTLQHGCQVGMVFEMYRSNAGFFKMMQESIESILERDVGVRENGEVFEMKVALQLGRSLSELRDVAASSSTNVEEFGSKLF